MHWGQTDADIWLIIADTTDTTVDWTYYMRPSIGGEYVYFNCVTSGYKAQPVNSTALWSVKRSQVIFDGIWLLQLVLGCVCWDKATQGRN